MTHNASFYADRVNAAAWNRARLVEANLSCFSWCINVMKSTRLESFQRDNRKRVRFTSEASILCFVLFCVIGLGPVASALGSVKRAPLQAFHALNGADITRRFSGKAKLSCWKTIMDAEEDTITPLRNVETRAELEPRCILQTRYWPLWRGLYASFISLDPVSHKSRN